MKLTKKRHVRHKTINTAVNEDLEKNSNVRTRRSFLTARSRATRVEKSPKPPNHLRNKKGDASISVHEKNFIVYEVANGQNTF